NNWSDIYINDLKSISCIYVLNANNIWISGRDGNDKQVILRSNNSGSSWVSIQRDYSINSFYFFDTQTGYAVGSSGLVLYTTNGGNSWTRHSTNSNRYLYSVSFGDAQTGCAVGSNGTVLKFTNNIDTAFWTISGNITNSAIQLITKSNDDPEYGSGYYYLNGNAITFTVISYSGGIGNTQVGSGTFAITDKFTLNLDLANNEKWKIILKR
ncbi:MAG: YCF48-related protein, partial [Ignavibacteria bacterium]